MDDKRIKEIAETFKDLPFMAKCKIMLAIYYTKRPEGRIEEDVILTDTTFWLRYIIEELPRFGYDTYTIKKLGPHPKTQWQDEDETETANDKQLSVRIDYRPMQGRALLN